MCSDVYSGSQAFSEKESQAVETFIMNNRQNMMAYLTYHSYGQMWLYPWGYTSSLPADWQELVSSQSINEGLKKFLGWVGVGVGVGVGAKLLLLLLISIYKQRKPDWAGNWRKRSQILQYMFSSYIHVGVWNVRSIQAFPILKKLITYSLTRNIFRENVFTVCCKKRKRN